MLPSSRPRASLRAVARALGIALAIGVAAPVAAAPADDWSLEHGASDPSLVGQRFAKLRARPFDGAQWRALERAIGRDGLRKKIAAALARKPDDVALGVLDARASMLAGDPAEAARKLAAIEARAGRLREQVLDLRVDALVAAGKPGEAIAAIESSKPVSREALARAFAVADRAGLAADALRLAQALAAGHERDVDSHLRLARAATANGDTARADAAYARAIELAKPRVRDEIAVERARAWMDAGDPANGAKLVWSLLEDPRHGSAAVRAPWWELLTEAHRRADSNAALVSALEPWLERHRGEAAAWRALAQATEAMGQDATVAWRRALELDPRDEASHGALIDTLEAKGEGAAAVAEYRRLLARSPDEIQVGLDLAGRLIASGQRELAMQLAAEIETRVGRRAQPLLLLLDFYNLNDEPDRALAVARRVVDSHPSSAEARIALGEQLYQMDRTTEALAQWAHLPKLIRPRHKGHARYAEVLAEHGRIAEATEAIKPALEAAPDEPQYLRLRAVLAEEQRRPVTALELWEQVRRVASGPDQALLRAEARTRVVELLVEGAIPQRIEKLIRAESEARAALEGGKPLADAIEAGELLAELYTRKESYAAAVDVQEQLRALQPGSADRLVALAAAQRRAGRPEDALVTLEPVRKLEPQREADTLALMAELAFEAGEPERALESATRATELDRTHVEALVRLGELHEKQGDLDEAARAYAKALEHAPDDARARLHAAELDLTRGDVERSAKMLRSVLDKGGPPELVREAGRRALDLAEASHTTVDLLALAVQRSTRSPEADEPRELLLDALDRVERDDVERWLRGGSTKKRDVARVSSLRKPLVAALGRGSIGGRMRAAEHLGRLELPETAMPLAKLAASLTAPRDATPTVRDAFERTRVAAIRAAGELRDPAAVPAFASILGDGAFPVPARNAAAWALARTGGTAAVGVLGPAIREDGDPLVVALGCIALASVPRDGADRAVAARAAEVARTARNEQVRHACAYAEATLTTDADLGRLLGALRGSDPMAAAIAAWRLGRVASLDEDHMAALLRSYLGPPGLARDAAGAAIARVLGDARPASDTDAGPPAPRGRNWSTSIERWLVARVAPRHASIRAEQLDPHRGALARALAEAASGTRAEQLALRRIRRGCEDGKPAEGALCLAPLVRETLRQQSTVTSGRRD